MPQGYEDIRPFVLVTHARRNNTVASGVIDLGDLGYPGYVCATMVAGDILSGATSGSILRLYSSNTVSATASGMTAITSANTSGLTFTNSSQTISVGVDLRGGNRFLGATLSTITNSASIGAVATFRDHAEIPPDAATGSQIRFIGQ